MRIPNLRLSVCALLMAAVSACASNGGGAPITGERVEDINWIFADEQAMTAKLASLESENSKLKRQVDVLQGQLAAAQDDAKAAEAAADAARLDAERSAALRAQANPAEDPVIAAPQPNVDVPDGAAKAVSAPRLVQPTFASTEPIFENEANGDRLQLSSVLWGVHLDSYSRERFAREGWRRLQRAHPDELGLLEPRMERVLIEGRGEMLRLIGGGFASEATARALCRELSTKSQYCRVVTFDGERLSLNDPS